MNVNIKRLNEAAVIPQYAHEGDAGFDLVAVEDTVVEPGETVKVPTGLAFEIPAGMELQVRPRSGITSKTKLRVQLGTVDAGYRGEVGVIVDNIAQKEIYDIDLNRQEVRYWEHDYPMTIDGKRSNDFNYFGSRPTETYLIRAGDRIAQGILAPVAQVSFIESDMLSNTQRGGNGFGSTGS